MGLKKYLNKKLLICKTVSSTNLSFFLIVDSSSLLLVAINPSRSAFYKQKIVLAIKLY